MLVFGGIEGGATKTTVMLFDEAGQELAQACGKGTNPWLQSVADVASILHDLCTQAKQACGASGPLRALGMCMSGFESKHKQVELLALLRGYGDVAEELMVYNDAVGSAFTASSNGSVVVICGTGSIAQLVMADASTHRCGGWGHMVSDEGSAFYVAQRALKRIFRTLDGRSEATAHDVSHAVRMMKEYFELPEDSLQAQYAMLPHLYDKFSKAYIAGFCKSLAEGADAGDAFCADMLSAVGKQVGAMVRALLVRFGEHAKGDASGPGIPTSEDGVLTIACAGSVWSSYRHFQTALADVLAPALARTGIRRAQFMHVRSSSAIGAANVAAKKVGAPLRVDHDAHTTALGSVHAAEA